MQSEYPEDVRKLAEDLIPPIDEEPGRNLRGAMVFYACRAIMQDRSSRPLVKELEWDGSRAASEVGFYAIQRADGEWALLRGKTDNFWQCIASGEAPSFHEAFFQAKAAAQADFSSRIRSCLLDKPEAVEGEPVGYVSQYTLDEIMGGRFGNIYPKGTLVPENEIPLYRAATDGAEVARLRKALTEVGEWINDLPIPTTGATRMLGIVRTALTQEPTHE